MQWHREGGGRPHVVQNGTRGVGCGAVDNVGHRLAREESGQDGQDVLVGWVQQQAQQQVLPSPGHVLKTTDVAAHVNGLSNTGTGICTDVLTSDM